MGPSKGDYGAAMWNEPVENRRMELHPIRNCQPTANPRPKPNLKPPLNRSLPTRSHFANPTPDKLTLGNSGGSRPAISKLPRISCHLLHQCHNHTAHIAIGNMDISAQ